MEVLPLTRALRILRNCCSYSNNQGRSNTTQNCSCSKPVRDKGAKKLNELIPKEAEYLKRSIKKTLQFIKVITLQLPEAQQHIKEKKITTRNLGVKFLTVTLRSKS